MAKISRASLFICLILIFLGLWPSAIFAQSEDSDSGSPTPAAPQNPPKSAKKVVKAGDKNDKEFPSTVSTDLKVDTSSSTDFNADGDISFGNGTSFSIGYERAQSPPSSSSPDSLDTSEIRLGYGSDSDPDFAYTLNYALWGTAGQVWSSTFGVDLKYNTDNWTFHVNPQLRIITFAVSNLSLARAKDATVNRLNVSDPILSLSANYLGIDKWHFKATAAYYAYSRQISDLNAPGLSKFFSSSALTLANNFNEYEASLEIGYEFKVVSFAVEDMYAMSEYDFSLSSIFTFKTTFTFVKNLDIELDVGNSPATTSVLPPGTAPVGSTTVNPTVNFIELGLTYSF